MSFPGSTIKKQLKVFLPFTWRGALFLFLSCIFLISGILRIDLALLLWGGAFLLISVYTLLGNHLTRVIARNHFKKRPGAYDIFLPVKGHFPGTVARADIRIELPAFLLPGFVVYFSYILTWRNHRSIRIECRLTGRTNSRVIEFPAEKRGDYHSDIALLIYRDVLGFTRGSIPLNVEERVRIFPDSVPAADNIRRLEEGGEATEFVKRRRLSEERLEVRKYYPGDDPRRLNWKVYAHLGELFLRVGEETPPPESRIFVILDSNQSGQATSEFSADYLDSIVEACTALMQVLLLRGINIIFAAPGMSNPSVVSMEKYHELLSLLSGIWWNTKQKSLQYPVNRNIQAIIFSSPGSPGLQSIVESVKSRGWNLSLIFKTFNPPPAAKKISRLKRSLFVQEKSGNNRKKIRNFSGQLEEAITAEITRYRGAPWRLKNVHRL